jgi:hypothetical protein
MRAAIGDSLHSSSFVLLPGIRPGSENQALMDRLYTLYVDHDQPVELPEKALMSAWGSSVPDLALKVRALEVGEKIAVWTSPSIEVERVQ